MNRPGPARPGRYPLDPACPGPAWPDPARFGTDWPGRPAGRRMKLNARILSCRNKIVRWDRCHGWRRRPTRAWAGDGRASGRGHGRSGTGLSESRAVGPSAVLIDSRTGSRRVGRDVDHLMSGCGIRVVTAAFRVRKHASANLTAPGVVASAGHGPIPGCQAGTAVTLSDM